MDCNKSDKAKIYEKLYTNSSNLYFIDLSVWANSSQIIHGKTSSVILYHKSGDHDKCDHASRNWLAWNPLVCCRYCDIVYILIFYLLWYCMYCGIVCIMVLSAMTWHNFLQAYNRQFRWLRYLPVAVSEHGGMPWIIFKS